MSHYISWFADAPTAAFRQFEQRRVTSITRLAAATRRLVDRFSAHATTTMAEAAWAEAGWAESYRPKTRSH